MPHFMIVFIPYQFIKPFLDKKKCLFLRNMEPLKLKHLPDPKNVLTLLIVEASGWLIG